MKTPVGRAIGQPLRAQARATWEGTKQAKMEEVRRLDPSTLPIPVDPTRFAPHPAEQAPARAVARSTRAIAPAFSSPKVSQFSNFNLGTCI